MMNVAISGSAPLPSHFAPPARVPSTRRQLYHHPTLHMRSESGSTSLQSAQEFVPPQSPLSIQYSPPPTSQQFPRTTSSQSLPPQIQHPAHAHSQQHRNSLQRPAAGSANSLTQYIQPGPHMPAGHRRQISSTTSNSSINHISSGHSQYPSSTPPMIQSRPNSMPSVDTYVARLRRAKATVWSARGQLEDLDRSNSKEDKYNRKYSKRVTPQKVIPV